MDFSNARAQSGCPCSLMGNSFSASSHDLAFSIFTTDKGVKSVGLVFFESCLTVALVVLVRVIFSEGSSGKSKKTERVFWLQEAKKKRTERRITNQRCFPFLSHICFDLRPYVYLM
jgi:hypothetical protein